MDDVPRPGVGVPDGAPTEAIPPMPIAQMPPQPQSPAPCLTCGTPATPAGVLPPASSSPGGLVYAIGKIEPRFPSLSVEKEIAQVTGRAETAGLTDSAAFQKVLSDPDNRYLARQLCWVLAVGGIETYVLIPRDPADLSFLIASVRPNPEPTDLDVVIGVQAGTAPPSMCNGLTLPVVAFDRVYSFDRASLLSAHPESGAKKGAPDTPASAAEVFDRILHMTGNTGATPQHRAINYLAVRFRPLYAQTATAFADGSALTSVEVRPSPLMGVRQIVAVIVTYTDRVSNVETKFSVGVDVTDAFPFVIGALSPHYDVH